MPVVEAPVAAPPGVSVIVCAYTVERIEPLLDALRSLRAQTLAPAQVVVVVDHNIELLELVRTHGPEVIVIENIGPRGLSSARNCGVAAAIGEVVAFLDDDAVPAPDWVERLSDAYADPRTVGAGGLAAPVFESERPGWLPVEFDWVIGCSYLGQPEDPAPVRNLIGANMSFRRAALERVGAFTADLGRVGADASGCEETELCIRIGNEYGPDAILYDPTAMVHHQVPDQRATLRYFLTRCYAEGRSKAEVVRRCGRARGLASERSYVRRTLPRGVLAGLRAFVRGEFAGLARAAAIVAGLLTTAAGYIIGMRRGAVAR